MSRTTVRDSLRRAWGYGRKACRVCCEANKLDAENARWGNEQLLGHLEFAYREIARLYAEADELRADNEALKDQVSGMRAELNAGEKAA